MHPLNADHRRFGLLLLSAVLVLLTGCLPRGRQPVAPSAAPPLLPIGEAVARVNNNVAGITKPLWGGAMHIGAVVHDENGKVHREPNLDGTLRFLPPRDLYLDIKHVGAGVLMHVGSNDQLFWVWVKLGRDSLWYGRWADLDPAETYNIPLPPEMILAAMGLAPLPAPGPGLIGPIPRVDDDRYYKLQYLVRSRGALSIEREYWLDRYPPFLPRQVIFRNPDGRDRMRSTLDRYEPVGDSHVYIARDIHMTWPDEGDNFSMRMGSATFRDLPAGAFRMDENRITIPRKKWNAVTSPRRPAGPSTAAPVTAQPPATEPAAEPAASAVEPAAQAPEPAATRPVQDAPPLELESSPE